MDHHDDWAQWHEDEHGLDNADTADLDHHTGDPGGHEHLGGFDDLEDHGHGGYDAHPDEPAPDLGHDLSPAPDLVHEGGLDAHDLAGGADLGHDDLGHDDLGHDDLGHDPHDLGHDAAGQDHLVGADPDLPAEHHGFHDGDFPPPLDLDHRPDPSDGYPWADPDTLGDPGPDHGSDPTAMASYGGAPAGDLFAYAGMDAAAPGADPWQLLLGSNDPATSSLARWWGPFSG